MRRLHDRRDEDMTALAVDLDHIGTAVADLDAGRAAYERLGFNLTPRSQHRGALAPGEPPQLLGQGNHCAMLEQGYLEVLGIFDRSLPTPAQQYLDKYAGPHIVAFRPRSIEQLSALAASGAPIEPPRELGREVPYGPQGAERRRVEFRNSKFRPAHVPEATFFFTEHLTRDVMWQPHLLVQPNGAKRLARAYLFSTDARDTARRLAVLLGTDAREDSDGAMQFTFDNSALHVLPDAALRRRFPGMPVPSGSRPVGYAVAVASLDKLTTLLRANGVPFQQAAAGGIVVAPDAACGNIFHFIAEGS
jgi:catechol 2,3-dioxygenase-like lactoylglutathione lyase family enzyme